MATNIEVILDNGGGLTVQSAEFVHNYESDTYTRLAEHAAYDVKQLLTGADPSGWEGNEPDHRIEYTQDDLRNGGYKVLDEGDLREVLAGTYPSLSHFDTCGYTERLFLAALSGREL